MSRTIAGVSADELLSLAWWHGAQACNLPDHHKVPKEYHARTAKVLRDIARMVPWMEAAESPIHRQMCMSPEPCSECDRIAALASLPTTSDGNQK